MASDSKNVVYKSYEQLRSKLFPRSVEQERIKQAKQNAEEFGRSLADKAINQMLSSTK